MTPSPLACPSPPPSASPQSQPGQRRPRPASPSPGKEVPGNLARFLRRRRAGDRTGSGSFIFPLFLPPPLYHPDSPPSPLPPTQIPRDASRRRSLLFLAASRLLQIPIDTASIPNEGPRRRIISDLSASQVFPTRPAQHKKRPPPNAVARPLSVPIKGRRCNNTFYLQVSDACLTPAPQSLFLLLDTFRHPPLPSITVPPPPSSSSSPFLPVFIKPHPKLAIKAPPSRPKRQIRPSFKAGCECRAVPPPGRRQSQPDAPPPPRMLAFRDANMAEQEIKQRQGWHYQADAGAKALAMLTGHPAAVGAQNTKCTASFRSERAAEGRPRVTRIPWKPTTLTASPSLLRNIPSPQAQLPVLAPRRVASASRSARHPHQLRAALNPMMPRPFDTPIPDDSIALSLDRGRRRSRKPLLPRRPAP
ncbi:hypothetical protein C7M84_011738 [Penaeus vannamei]|uniref:Uncharacterized protein n=1 Tax=Penaeus vannamei TaxID=6689 RepID=A0A3R7NY62_PENVA|nr:hypothetical protein C7M84_011738 [Penaeus vannamei]